MARKGRQNIVESGPKTETIINYTVLPNEVWFLIFTYLFRRDLYHISLSAKFFRDLAKHVFVAEINKIEQHEYLNVCKHKIVIDPPNKIYSVIGLHFSYIAISLGQSIVIANYETNQKHFLEGYRNNVVLLHKINAQYFCSLNTKGTIRFWDWQKAMMVDKIKLNIKQSPYKFCIVSNNNYLLVGKECEIHVINIPKFSEKKVSLKRIIFWKMSAELNIVKDIIIKKSNIVFFITENSEQVNIVNFEKPDQGIIGIYKNIASLASLKENILIISTTGMITLIDEKNCSDTHDLEYDFATKEGSYQCIFSVPKCPVIIKKGIKEDSKYIYTFWQNKFNKPVYQTEESNNCNVSFLPDGNAILYSENEATILRFLITKTETLDRGDNFTFPRFGT